MAAYPRRECGQICKEGSPTDTRDKRNPRSEEINMTERELLTHCIILALKERIITKIAQLYNLSDRNKNSANLHLYLSKFERETLILSAARQPLAYHNVSCWMLRELLFILFMECFLDLEKRVHQ